MALVYSGGTYVNATFTGDTKWAIMKNLRDQLVNAGWTNVAQASGQGVGNAATATITIASPGVVTMAGHGFLGNERVLLATTGALPTGLAVNTVYFVKYVDANTFKLSTSSGGADINTSGTQSGTHTLYTESMLLQSATQSGVTNPIRVRLKDHLGTTNVMAVNIENQAGTLAGTINNTWGGFLLAQASQTMRVIASKYWFYCLVPGSTAARSFVMAGMPYVDSSILTSVTDIGYMFSSAQFDSNSGGATTCLRLGPSLNNPNSANWTCLYNTSMIQNANTSNLDTRDCSGAPELLLTTQPGSTTYQRDYRWANDDLLTSDVLVSWGLSSITGDEAKIRGQFYDMIYIGEAVAADTTSAITSTGHTFYNLTNSATGTNYYPRGGMWVRIDT